MKRCPTNKTTNAYIDKYVVQRKDNDVFCKKYVSIVTYFYQALNMCFLYDDFLFFKHNTYLAQNRFLIWKAIK